MKDKIIYTSYWVGPDGALHAEHEDSKLTSHAFHCMYRVYHDRQYAGYRNGGECWDYFSTLDEAMRYAFGS